MPEAPDLEVVKEVLARRVVGQATVQVRVVRPTVLRSLVPGEFSPDIQRRVLESVARRGKLLLLGLSGDRVLSINPMLTGLLQLCEPSSRLLKSTCLVLELSGGQHLRYLDDRQMGQVYYVSGGQLDRVPRLGEQGPDVLAQPLALEEFKARLHPFRGEIKGVLVRGPFISGIGNAYADEVLFDAGISPFQKRPSLTEEQICRLHESTYRVVADAVPVLRERMGETLHHKVRDFLQVHNKKGEPCPRCGHTINQLSANQRITSYCRRCQPGMLVRN